MSFICPIDWHIFFPEGFDNFHANQDTLVNKDFDIGSIDTKLHTRNI